MSEAIPQGSNISAQPAGPELSTLETLTGIFFEPGRVFESFRTKPRFLVASIIVLILTLLVTAVLYLRVDMAQFIRDKMERSPNAAQQTEQQKEMGVKIGKIIGAVAVPLYVVVGLLLGGLLYWVAVLIFGGTAGYVKALAVWAYSSLPPSVLGTFVAIAVLLLKPADTVDPEHLLLTNPGAFMSSESSPVLVRLLSQFDLLRFYGMFLAALGLRKVAKLSSSSAWAIVIILWVLGALLSVGSAALFGR
jgi:hypothetical protein